MVSPSSRVTTRKDGKKESGRAKARPYKNKMAVPQARDRRCFTQSGRARSFSPGARAARAEPGAPTPACGIRMTAKGAVLPFEGK